MEPEKLLQIWPSPTSPEILIKWKNFLDFEATEKSPYHHFVVNFLNSTLRTRLLLE